MIIKRVDESVTERFFKNDYHDRGMLKWGGFFLSDHTSAIKKMKQAEVPEKQLPEQSLEKISQRLQQAWINKHFIHIQLKSLLDGEKVDSLTGTVSGYYEEEIILADSEGELQAVKLEDIRNVHEQTGSVDWKNLNSKT
ncbi:DNA-directed RNA polymerase beta subunit [Pediococcus damnosus]|uniref:DNA-directed RNA polymerase beta subunit n=1 Tax=Pediococcus damnosus TaxID=51663 RepID=A0A0R2HR47_9LACO|nr:YolD-like family protein [Pediococcus damnosus]AMV60640.1 DNA-directed RNA polymerase beta subunit [Pediococcus damnosus]AMV62902.1 DNA-directed RNA polymerase beta subunit [Pediococcus damnosus]AMV64955.1 DNA-directed RNA polymerase beta subunit [Pediococcus damnosus]AMV67214.1 DNA-directed RNA polymerase beta subunit [Pediococcus damnosus]AMV69760.1 DNA-directed RNA polymerase beta subunit [Pediococcus damnosus]